MKALILSASRFRRRSTTSMLLNPFMAGLRESGVECDYFNTFGLTIAPCRGDLSCWFKTKGKCIHNDDMNTIIPLFKAADLIVLSTPVYVDGMPGDLKTVFDRLVAIGNPYFEIRNGQTRHPFTHENTLKKLVLISSCGLWEIEHFDPLLTHIKAICKNLGLTLSGTLLRPHSFTMRNFNINEILSASKQAGNEIFKYGSVSIETQNVVSQEIVPQHTYMDLMNNKAHSLLNP
jgi:multimeric flavodoxin WrbA